jgi:hypothetical protein
MAEIKTKVLLPIFPSKEGMIFQLLQGIKKAGLQNGDENAKAPQTAQQTPIPLAKADRRPVAIRCSRTQYYYRYH